jgi:hypothetical protein
MKKERRGEPFDFAQGRAEGLGTAVFDPAEAAPFRSVASERVVAPVCAGLSAL